MVVHAALIAIFSGSIQLYYSSNPSGTSAHAYQVLGDLAFTLTVFIRTGQMALVLFRCFFGKKTNPQGQKTIKKKSTNGPNLQMKKLPESNTSTPTSGSPSSSSPTSTTSTNSLSLDEEDNDEPQFQAMVEVLAPILKTMESIPDARDFVSHLRRMMQCQTGRKLLMLSWPSIQEKLQQMGLLTPTGNQTSKQKK